MSITDELREYAHDCCARIDDDIHAIADRIDAEHKKAEDEWRAKNGDMWLKGYAACHEELMEGHPVIAADLEKAGWVELPKDADGEYIRVGERVQLIGNDPSTVSHMSLADNGWRVYVKYDGGIGTGSGEPKRIRHYHAPTVEDVLREFALAVCKDDALTIRKGVIEEYAKRLTLAEGEDV